jgi:anti-sigma regulatory factor (Ser/Thr protein kinase)
MGALSPSRAAAVNPEEPSRRAALPHTAAAPSIARRLVADALSGKPTEVVDNALVLTSELVTNAVRHGHGDIELSLYVDPDTVHVEVSDAGRRKPRPPHSGRALSEDGRGLLILAALATNWGIRSHEDGPGKTVWFQLGD